MKKEIFYFLVALLGGMLFGYDTAVINGAMPFFTAYFQLTDAMVGWSVSSGLLGCILGAAFASYPADRIGRRETMKIVAFLFFLSSLGTAFATNFTLFVSARILGGIAVGIVSVTLPIYVSEITPPEKRGRSTINFQLGVVVGILLAFFVDYILLDTGEYNWRYMFLSMSLPALCFGGVLLKVSRSPRWLVSQRRIEEASKILREQQPDQDINRLLQEIEQSLSSVSERLPWQALFRKPYLKFIVIGLAVGVFSQLSGIAIVMYYATDIFRSAGFETDAAIGQTVIIGLTNLVFTLLAKSLIDRLGRRRLLLTGTMGMFVSLSLLTASYFVASFPSWILLLSLICFVACFASSMGAVSWVLLSEIFPNTIRSQGMSLGSLSNWMVNGTISFLFPIVAGAFDQGQKYCFLFFALSIFISYFFFRRYLFETKNKTLEEIEKENM